MRRINRILAFRGLVDGGGGGMGLLLFEEWSLPHRQQAKENQNTVSLNQGWKQDSQAENVELMDILSLFGWLKRDNGRPTIWLDGHVMVVVVCPPLHSGWIQSFVRLSDWFSKGKSESSLGHVPRWFRIIKNVWNRKIDRYRHQIQQIIPHWHTDADCVLPSARPDPLGVCI